MRRVAREEAFQILFEYTFYEKLNEDTLELMCLSSDMTDDDRDYLKCVYYGVAAHYEELRQIVAEHLSDYTLDRVFRPDLTVLLLATFELVTDVAPLKVCINEAVELAKKFGTDKSGGFVNGVLAKIVADLDKIKAEHEF